MEARSFTSEKAFSSARTQLEGLIQYLQTQDALRSNHVDLENQIDIRQREVSRLLFEESIKLRGVGEVGAKVRGSDGYDRAHRREGVTHMKSIFGSVEVTRLGYGRPGVESLYPLDSQLNLSKDVYSLNLRKMLGNEVAKDSFEEAMRSVEARTGVLVPKRQAEELSQKAAVDFQDFYELRAFQTAAAAQIRSADRPILVLTTDGKGIVMRAEDLREATRKRAAQAQSKFQKRVSRGEKRNAKRMAQVASVYEIDRHVRQPEQVAGTVEKPRDPPPRPINKRVWASVAAEQHAVIEDMFTEAEARDPNHRMEWVVLIDGQLSQLDRIQSEARRRKVDVTIIIDVIHVIEYLWKAARDLFEETDPKAEEWVTDHLLAILRGQAKLTAAGMRRSATFRQLKTEARAAIDKCADYLHNNASFLAYHESLQKGHPIATGVIEGACRYLVKDRMDITGARWSLKGAEAVLKLRSLHASGDLDEYWAFHQTKEFERNHESKYANPAILHRRGLRLV